MTHKGRSDLSMKRGVSMKKYNSVLLQVFYGLNYSCRTQRDADHGTPGTNTVPAQENRIF